MTGEDLIKASNWYQTRAHYAIEMTPYRTGEGFNGSALCTSDSNPVTVYDQSHHDAMYERGRGAKPKDLDKLPLCKKCVKQAEKRLGAVS